MLKALILCWSSIVLCFQVAQAQDIAGMEDCTKTSGLEKRTSCLQANVNFLQQLVTRNALEARQRLDVSRNEIMALRSAVSSLQASVDELRVAQKAAKDKKPESR
jgi:hypothetical protein